MRVNKNLALGAPGSGLAALLLAVTTCIFCGCSGGEEKTTAEQRSEVDPLSPAPSADQGEIVRLREETVRLRDEALRLQEEMKRLNASLSAAVSENEKLKEWIGHSPDEQIRFIEAKYTNDMLAFADPMPNSTRNYRGLSLYLMDKLREARENHAESALRQRDLETKLDRPSGPIDRRIAEAKAEFERARKDFEKEKQAIMGGRPGLVESREGASTSEKSAGTVVSVDMRERQVWIDLGRAAGVRRQMKFDVFEKGTRDVTSATPKGRVEVSQVQDSSQSVARILDNTETKPIAPGDLVYEANRPQPQTLHFALLGFIDIDGDGQSDRNVVRSLILTCGGVIDADVDEAGNRSGKLSNNTRYIVSGERPTGRDSAEAAQAYDKFRTDASNLGIEKISPEKLLDMISYLRKTR